MIRINLLGQERPKGGRGRRAPVDTGSALPTLFIGAGVLFGVLVLGYLYYSWQKQLTEETNQIKRLEAQKTELEQIKLQVEAFEKQKAVLTQRVQTIEKLQRDRTGGQELLDEVATTVSRAENLWLFSMVRKGNNLAFEGTSASINSVANFITALKRSGYFRNVEIKESKQDDKNVNVQTFNFQISAEISPPQPGQPAPGTQTKPPNAPAGSAVPARKG